MNILKQILRNKLEEIKAAKDSCPLEVLKRRIKKASRPRDFKKSISKKGKLCIIAEIKKASPSAGVIRRDFNPVRLAVSLEKAGADALSVLTDKKFFKGDLAFIQKIKPRVRLPVLRKDFLIDDYQVYESRAFGADAILLIAKILSRDKLKRLYSLTKRLKMSCIVEVHSRTDLIKALAIKPDIIGINNRNLRTFEVDLNTTFRLSAHIPKGKVIISESGLPLEPGCPLFKDLKRRGIQAVLIGESFMRMKSSNFVVTICN